MAEEDAAVAELLAECWLQWAERWSSLTAGEWTTATRCSPWDVAALVAHVAPDPLVLAALPGAAMDGPAAIEDPSVLLAGFNQPGAVAHAMAAEVSGRATALAAELGPEALADRFREGAAIVTAEPLPLATVLPHPVVGSVTAGVLAAVSIVEATVHHLDLIDAVGGELPPELALAFTRDVVVRVSEPAPLIEAMTGRRNPLTWFPLIH